MILFPNIFEAYEQEEYATMFSIEGRSLICTFLAGATKDATICLVSGEQAQNKKM